MHGPKAWRLALILTLGAASASAGPGPETTPAPILLKVDGEVGHSLKLSVAELARLPHRTLKAVDHGGTEVEFSGVPLVEVLKMAGLKLGEELRGVRLADFLLVEAADGYRAVFALPEIDPAFSDRVILLADQANGKPLSPREGPLRIIVPGEKRHGRWVRQVTSLSILHARSAPQ